MFEQAGIAVADVSRYEGLKARFDEKFSAREVEVFLNRVRRAGLRVRDLDQVLGRGLLGKGAQSKYEALVTSDQAQLREEYLRRVEAVLPEVRQRFYKVYASY